MQIAKTCVLITQSDKYFIINGPDLSTITHVEIKLYRICMVLNMLKKTFNTVPCVYRWKFHFNHFTDDSDS